MVLVEKEPQLGGLLHRLNIAWLPKTMRHRRQIAELSRAGMSRANITVHSGARVQEMAGYIGNYESTIRAEGAETVQERWAASSLPPGPFPLSLRAARIQR